MGLTFDAADHAYQLDGKPLDSVSIVLDTFRNNSFYTEESRRRGHIVHEITADDDFGVEPDPVKVAEFMGYYLSWRKFKQLRGFAAVEIEFPVYNSEHMYAGTPDRLCFLGNDLRLTLLDIKTGQPSPFTGLQLAAYNSAILDSYRTRHLKNQALAGVTRIADQIAVHLDANGGAPRAIEYGGRVDEDGWKHALGYHQWKKWRKA